MVLTEMTQDGPICDGQVAIGCKIVVKATLAEAGVRLHTFSHGWILLVKKKTQNLWSRCKTISHGHKCPLGRKV